MSLAFGGRHGGGFHGGASVHAFHGPGGFPVRHAFPFRRDFVVVGAAAVFPLGYYSYYGGAPYSPYYWYCANPGGYYPDIQYCPSGWLLVAP